MFEKVVKSWSWPDTTVVALVVGHSLSQSFYNPVAIFQGGYSGVYPSLTNWFHGCNGTETNSNSSMSFTAEGEDLTLIRTSGGAFCFQNN